jgi:hypothetical protein
MEQTFVHLAETAAWVFLLVFAFAVIGVVATVRWIIGLFWSAEHAVETGVHNVTDQITHHNQ